MDKGNYYGPVRNYSKYTEHIEANFLKNIRISSHGEKVAIPIKRVQQYFSMRKPYFVVSKIESNKLLKVSLEVKICLLEIPWKYQLQYAEAHSLRNTSCWSYYHFKGKNYSNCLNSLQGQLTLMNYVVCRKCSVTALFGRLK